MLETTERGREYQERLTAFMDEFVYAAEPIYHEQMAAAASPHTQPQILEDLKAEAKRQGLWNLFHPHPEWGPGLTNLEYAPLAGDHRSQHRNRAGGHQLQRPGYRKYGGLHPLRHR